MGRVVASGDSPRRRGRVCAPERTGGWTGFAGGLGLSGNGCGALSAAIWKRSLDWVKENPGKSAFGNKYAKSVLKKFMEITNSETECQQICSQKFESIQDHSEFIKKGGCQNIIDGLSNI